MGIGHSFLGNSRLGLPDSTGRLNSADGLAQRRVHQPVPGGHGSPIVKERSIGDDRRHAILGTDHHVKGASRWSAQQFGYQGVIVDARAQVVSGSLVSGSFVSGSLVSGSFVGPPTDRAAR